MALQNFDVLRQIPWITSANCSLEQATGLLNADGEKAALVFQAPKTGNLWKVGFQTGTVVQDQTIRVSFQNVGADGFPDETRDEYRDVSITDGNDNAWKLTGIISSDGTDSGTKRAVTKGDVVAVVLEHFPFNTGDEFRLSWYTDGFSLRGFPSHALKTGGAWARGSYRPNFVLLYDDGNAYYIPSAGCFTSVLIENFGSGERGLKFKLPFPCKIAGFSMNSLSLGSDLKANVYDSDATTLLGTITLDRDLFPADGGTYDVFFDTPVSLSKDTFYYLVLEATSTTYLISGQVDQNGYLAQLTGRTDWILVNRAGAGSGAFTETNTKIPSLFPFFSAFDDAASGGGGGGASMPGVISF